jgi:hypothetical protein
MSASTIESVNNTSAAAADTDGKGIIDRILVNSTKLSAKPTQLRLLLLLLLQTLTATASSTGS